MARSKHLPDVPEYGTWNDLNERKQRQLLAGLPIHDYRPAPPAWAQGAANRRELGQERGAAKPPEGHA